VTLKDIGRKIWHVALKLSEYSCRCGWECGECGACDNLANLYTKEPGNNEAEEGCKNGKTMT
jgi:hypothetical protein